MPRTVSGPGGDRARASEPPEREDAALLVNNDSSEGAPSVSQSEAVLVGPSGEQRRERRLTIEVDSMQDFIVKEIERLGWSGAINYTRFQRLFEQYPEEFFASLCEQFDRLEKKADKAAMPSDGEVLASEEREELIRLRNRVKDQRRAMAELTEERDTFHDRVEELERQGREGTAFSMVATQKKSTKLPDGQVFSDGKDPKFESWLVDVQNKLEANADHYLTALARMQYVKSMCKGEAAEHLLPRFRKDSPQRYNDVEDMFEHLKTIYQDANRVTSAKRKFRRLFMNDMKFQEFLSKFVLLAQEAEFLAAQ